MKGTFIGQSQWSRRRAGDRAPQREKFLVRRIVAWLIEQDLVKFARVRAGI